MIEAFAADNGAYFWLQRLWVYTVLLKKVPLVFNPQLNISPATFLSFYRDEASAIAYI